jgi:hypothetical protein
MLSKDAGAKGTEVDLVVPSHRDISLQRIQTSVMQAISHKYGYTVCNRRFSLGSRH